jgi:hypothetical protein
VLDRVDQNGNLGPYYLFMQSNEAVAIAILEKIVAAGFDLTAHDRKGRTLLQALLATRTAFRPRIAEWLIEHGALGFSELGERSIDMIAAHPRYSKELAPVIARVTERDAA